MQALRPYSTAVGDRLVGSFAQPVRLKRTFLLPLRPITNEPLNTSGHTLAGAVANPIANRIFGGFGMASFGRQSAIFTQMSRADVSIPAVLIEARLTELTSGMYQDSPSQVARNPHLSVVMPVYNEMATIKEILARVQAVDIDKEIILVDDGSTDGTREFLAELAIGLELHSSPMAEDYSGRLQRRDPIRIFLQKKNYGKGAALRRGFQKARGEIVIVQDADLELDPQEYPKLLEPIELGVADVVYGSRFLGRPPEKVSFAHYLGNKLLTVSSNALTGMKLTDVWTGYKVFRREVLQTIDIREDRFGFEPEITAKVAKHGCRLQEVPVSYCCRAREDGKKISWKDGFRGMWCTFRYSLFR